MIDRDALIKGRLLSRYKRFFADIELDDGGQVVTAYCPNPGKMVGLLAAGTPALITRATNPKARLAYRLEALKADNGWVGVNTGWPNRLIQALIVQKKGRFCHGLFHPPLRD